MYFGPKVPLDEVYQTGFFIIDSPYKYASFGAKRSKKKNWGEPGHVHQNVLIDGTRLIQRLLIVFVSSYKWKVISDFCSIDQL
jgi:hypothetical protein